MVKRKANKPTQGHHARCGKGPFRILREFKVEPDDDYKVGQEVKVDIFKPGDVVDLTGTSKGKGFQGTVKRWKFNRGPMSHGSMNKRPPGSIGSSAFPSRVIKGKRLPGHMGDRRVTLQNRRIHQVDPERNLIYVVGDAPGARNSIVMIRSAVKAS